MRDVIHPNVEKLLRVFYVQKKPYTAAEMHVLYNKLYKPQTLSRQLLSRATRRSSIDYRLAILIKEGYLVKKPRKLGLNPGPPVHEFEITLLGKSFCALTQSR